MANSQTIAQVLAEIGTLYPLMFQPTVEQTAVWAMYLRDIDDELLVMALRHYISTAKDNYPPSVPALRKAAAELVRAASGVPTAFQAWSNLLHGAGRMQDHVTDEVDAEGRMIVERGTIPWLHPIVERVARQLGWPAFPGDNPEADRAHFFRAYESEVTEGMTEEREMPEVRRFVERRKQTLLPEIGDLVKQLEVAR